jgi:signal transduction histidine kinase
MLERRISAMKNAARRVRDLRQFVSDSLDNLPDATLVSDTEGRVLLANRHAHHYLARLPGAYDLASAADSKSESPRGASVHQLFAKLHSAQPLDQPANARFDWADLLDVQKAKALANGVGVRDEQDRDLLLKSAPCHSANGALTGWIVSVIDISTIRQVERSRDETLRFLSHDMRAPQASILAMLELQQEPTSAIAQSEFFSRIEKAARKTLGLADNFVQLARAESQEYRLEEVDFQDVLFDATDEMWSLSRSKHIAITADIESGEYPVQVDRPLMTRALTNLLSNAINYSPENTHILCTVRVHQMQVVCCIRDQGYGIAAADQAKLFRRFQRVDLPNQPRHDGIGLGLVFVKTVTERHQGSILFSSVVGEGTRFTLTLPLYRPNATLMPVGNKL